MSETRVPLHKQIVQVLKEHGDWITASQIAAKIGRERGDVSSIISKMYAYGSPQVERSEERRMGPGAHWRFKQGAEVA